MGYEFEKLSCEDMTKALASTDAVPCGGAGVALVGALAVSLGNMAGNLTVNKPQFAEVKSDMEEALVRGEQLRLRFLELMNQDAEDFAPMSKAFKLPKDTAEQRFRRDSALEEARKLACKTPMELMDACLDALQLMSIYVSKGSPLLVSDAAVGAALCRGVMEAGYLNVCANTCGIRDCIFSGDTDERAQEMLRAGRQMSELIIQQAQWIMKARG